LAVVEMQFAPAFGSGVGRRPLDVGVTFPQTDGNSGTANEVRTDRRECKSNDGHRPLVARAAGDTGSALAVS